MRKESRFFKINDKNISELAKLDIKELAFWFENVDAKLSKKQNIIAKEIIKEIKTRISFLLNVGLDYLSLDRQSKSLSGGESQRIRLATQIGSQLVNVLYILDEPSIGLHQRDNEQLINALKNHRNGSHQISIDTNDLNTIHRFGMDVFKKNLSVLDININNIIITGKNRNYLES